MPHHRNRYIEPQIKKALSWAPVVALLGMRQVGKTTLLRKLARSYLSCDDDQVALDFSNRNWSTLEALAAPTAVDECQKIPPLFDRVKLLSDQRNRPGQFILTGSVRFLSKKQIRESLTGRIATLELLPMNLAECHAKPLSLFVKAVFQHKGEKLLESLNGLKRFKLGEVLDFLNTGGMPGICFKRDAAVRSDLWENHLETLLSRDIQMLYSTRLAFLKLRQLLFEIVRLGGASVNISALARKAGSSVPTVQKILRAMEDLFLIRAHGSTFFCSDQGLASHLEMQSRPHARADIIRLVHQEILCQLSYLYRGQFILSEYQTRGGVDVPFDIQIKDKGRIGIVISSDEGIDEKGLKSLTWFKKKHPKSIVLGLHIGNSAYLSGSGIPCIPVNWIY